MEPPRRDRRSAPASSRATRRTGCRACLDSLDWCDEILVVDSHSRDRTRELAAARGARVIERDWPGHVAQKEFAIREAQHDWVLCIDADERVSPELAAEIERLRARGFDGCAGFAVPRLSRYLGRWIRHGTWYPDWKLRLFDRRRGRWGGRDPHDRVEVRGRRRGASRASCCHDPYRSFDEHLAHDRPLHHDDGRAAARRRAPRAPARRRAAPARALPRLLRAARAASSTAGAASCSRYLAAHYVRLKYAKLWVRPRA